MQAKQQGRRDTVVAGKAATDFEELCGRIKSPELASSRALGIAAIALAISAFFAAVIPARRAASISPMKALRTE